MPTKRKHEQQMVPPESLVARVGVFLVTNFWAPGTDEV